MIKQAFISAFLSGIYLNRLSDLFQISIFYKANINIINNHFKWLFYMNIWIKSITNSGYLKSIKVFFNPSSYTK